MRFTQGHCDDNQCNTSSVKIIDVHHQYEAIDATPAVQHYLWNITDAKPSVKHQQEGLAPIAVATVQSQYPESGLPLMLPGQHNAPHRNLAQRTIIGDRTSFHNQLVGVIA